MTDYQSMTLKILKEESGSALVTVLIIISLLTILTMAILGAKAWQQRFIRRDLNRMQAFYLAEAGIQKSLWMLANDTKGDADWRVENYSLPLFDSLAAQVSVWDWGGFVVVESDAEYKNQTSSLEVLAGECLPPNFDQAVIVGGVDYPLVVTGETRIVGDATVGKAGVKTGIIRGQGFRGRQIVEGKTHIQTPPQMPYFNPAQLAREVNRFQWLFKNPQGTEIFQSLTITPEISEEFSESKMIYVHGDLVLSGEDFGTRLDFDGPEVVVASGKITFQPAAKISGRKLFIAAKQVSLQGPVTFQDCIFYGHTGITTSGAVQGAGQFISPQQIRIGSGTQLEYPSLVYCAGQVIENKIEGKIELESQAVVTGTVLFYPSASSEKKALRNNGQLVLATGSQVTGVVYSANIATIEGAVNGLVVTDKFRFYLAPTTYINWLKDAVIDRSGLPGDFVLPVGFGVRKMRVTKMNVR